MTAEVKKHYDAEGDILYIEFKPLSDFLILQRGAISLGLALMPQATKAA